MFIKLFTTPLLSLLFSLTSAHPQPNTSHGLRPRNVPGSVYICPGQVWSANECLYKRPDPHGHVVCWNFSLQGTDGQPHSAELKLIGPDEGGVCELFTGEGCKADTWIALTTFPGTTASWNGVHSVKCYVPDKWRKTGRHQGVPWSASLWDPTMGGSDGGV